jgi:hypothetical protein
LLSPQEEWKKPWNFALKLFDRLRTVKGNFGVRPILLSASPARRLLPAAPENFARSSRSPFFSVQRNCTYSIFCREASCALTGAKEFAAGSIGRKASMTIKYEEPASLRTANGGAPARTKSREPVVTALVIESPDLELHTSILNLLWYSVECINSLPSISGKNKRNSEHFIRCVSQLGTLAAKNSSSMDSRVRKQLFQFLEEAEKASEMLREFLDKEKSRSASDNEVVPLSASGEISAKATYLQWLAVCMSEDLRLPCTEPAPHHTA